MFRGWILTLICLHVRVSLSSLDEKYLCTEQFCEKYVSENSCPKVDIACRAQNTTHNGRLYESPTPCNCCEFCLENLNEGDWCTIGIPGSPLPSKICGPGLTCVAHKGQHATCESMKDHDATPCYEEQNKFDKDKELGKIGSYRPRPKCDKDGYYDAIRCNPGQTCHCLNEHGQRIFGEAVETEAIEFEMKCECARLASTAREVIEPQFPIMTARCDTKGSYDAIQCINDECFCVDPSGGLNGDESVNITRGLSELPCYNRTLHRHLKSMDDYLRPCEANKMKKHQEKYELFEEGHHVIDFDIEECHPDGYYLPVRTDKARNKKYCSDEFGELIENYEADISDAKTMNCKCARSRKMLMEANALEIPICDKLGNYPPATCRRGLCFCQDQDGLQTSNEVDISDKCSLSCCPKGKCGCVEY